MCLQFLIFVDSSLPNLFPAVYVLPSLPGPPQSTSLVVDLSLLPLAANRGLPPDILLQCPCHLRRSGAPFCEIYQIYIVQM